MPKNPWEWLYERQSQPLKEYVLDEVAKYLAVAVEQFPPQIHEWEREDLRARYAPVLAQASGAPSAHVLRLALQLYRWDLERDVERIDAYLARGHYEELGTFGALEKETALFLWNYWMDQTLAFKEYAQGKFTWRELLGLADRLETRLVGNPPPMVTLH